MSFPKTIQAITINKNGGVDALEKQLVPFPQQNPSNVLVKVHYGGVNFVDTYYRSGLYPTKSFPLAIGTEASGVIVALPTDEAVLNDEQYKKRGYKVGDKVAVMTLGSHAEYVSAPYTKVYAVPESVSLLIAAASILQGLTALTFMTESYYVKKGDYVFIHTIAGGLGLIFSQIAKHRGAIVIGTTSTPEKAEVAKKHGADHVILYTKENTVDRVLEITNGEGVHVVYDGVGKDTFEDDFKLLRRKGTLVSVGNASGPVPPFAPLKLVEKNLAILRPALANYTVTPEETLQYGTELFQLISSGVIKIVVYKEYPFTTEGVREAQTDLTTRGGKTIGKLVIKIAEN
ncbi:NAD-P-binding protein [Laetiporus sulphureus 93-53]|uniref:Probable quinone oxidoreductase n=1 Tax=Laetiporus sulphureus 93-53 TaxID=1314785 RepID=A0A165FBY9_9APHY|nr:NAD-P-binding protein [Laetiporus sulphureus 93-53]KZT08736.1 NAD-P-binding protein [Laetiporus sulphureus 93-53]